MLRPGTLRTLLVGLVLAASGLDARAAPPQRRGSLLDRALRGPLRDVKEIVFAVRGASGGHWYETFGHCAKKQRWLYGTGGGRLCRLNLRSGAVTTILSDPKGGVRDPHVHYDGGKILFSYRRGGAHTVHLYEINLDGSGLRQITDGPWDDMEPIYTPGGDIIFVSSRCRCYVPCWFTQVAILYRCGPSGENIHPISSNTEHENTPQMLPDGRVLYMRWEYIDRNNVAFHHLWTVNPDGTGQMTYFGNMHPGAVFIDARPIPAARDVVFVHSPGHGRSEHQGRIALVHPDGGPDDLLSIRYLTKGANYRDPYPLGADLFLVARGKQLLLLDASGRTEPIYTLRQGDASWWVHEPQVLRPRPREPVIPDRIDKGKTTGRFALIDVTRGRNMRGVKPGQIRKLLLLEPLPKPVNFNGWMGAVSFKRSYFLERIVGTVPVEPDGSACFEVPANRPVLFVALDEGGRAVKRMRSFTSAMPGETTGCVGCHESRTGTGPADARIRQALRKPPAVITPIAGIPDVLDFPRDIQPILDRHCIKCHNYDKPPPAGLPLIGARGQWFSHSYFALVHNGHGTQETWRRLSSDPPRTCGSGAARLMKVIDSGHNRTKLSPREKELIRLWIDCNCPYAGTYAALGTGVVPLRVSREVLQRRCGGCHAPSGRGRGGGWPSFKGSYGFTFWAVAAGRNDWETMRRRMPFLGDTPAGSERLYNLTTPRRSPILLAPLAKEAGGWGVCRARTAPAQGPPSADEPKSAARKAHAVFAGTSDPDYRQILADIRFTKAALDEQKRFDMPGFRPGEHYVREMKRYGVLPPGFDLARDPINVYETDQAYWRSLWWAPQ